jgi:dihydroorotate dehydrogenase electron transfer subunit
MKKKTTMTVTDMRCLAEGIYSMKLQYPEWDMPQEVKPGQFAGLYPNDPSKLLPRPISICRWDPGRGELRFVFRTAGPGTESLAALRTGDRVDMLGILGNGYDPEKLSGKRVLLLGGGIGIPPMVELAAVLSELPGTEVTAVMGYRDSDLFLTKELSACARLLIATEDGSVGTKGNVLDAVRENDVRADVICACGPMPMLRAVKKYAAGSGVPAYISLEERMACGVGACLGCVTKTAKVDEHSHVHNARICTEGPVFEAGEVEIG